MNRNLPEESTLRQYLLGRLDDQEDVEGRLSEQILLDDELSEIVDSMEDEIIEDYLDGTLSSADKEACKRHFLLPSERQEKLRFAILLRAHFEEKTGPASESDGGYLPEPTPGPIVVGPNIGALVHLRSHGRTYCELAVLVVLTLSSVLYLSWLGQTNQKK